MNGARTLALSAVGLVVASFSAAPERPEAGHVPRPAANHLAALLENGNTLSGYVDLALTTEALAANQEVVDGSLSQLGLFAAAVECALPEGESVEVTVNGTAYELPGAYGMAPEWAEAPCDEACQEWVSACILPRLNNWNIRARIYLRTSDHDERDPGRDGDSDTSDRAGFDVEEGAFFGNLFSDPPRLYTCRGRGRDPLYDVIRVCTHPDGHCGVTPVGPCLPGEDDPETIPHACETMDAHGAFRRCHGRLSRTDGTFPADAHTFDRLVSVYLPRTAFASGLEAAGTCSEDPPPGEHELRDPAAAAASAGDACQTDDDCASAEMTCRTMAGPGFCTSACEADPDPAVEEAACGAGATCLVHTTGNSHCVEACTPVVAGGAGCPAGRVCTRLALLNEVPDDPGCKNFCSSDADCLPTQHCGRDGICVLESFGGEMADRLPDGYPCAVGGDQICRGLCVALRPTEGICASLIDLADTDVCPDDPDAVRPTREPGDDLAACLFRRCSTTAECPAPLRCLPGPIAVGSICRYG